MYLRYAGWAAIALIAFLFTWITCPIWALIAATFKLGSLPGPLAWVHTHDDNIYGAKMRRADDGELDTIPATFGKRFRTACWWIWRNPNYGFNANVLGLPVEGTTILEKYDEFEGRKRTNWILFERNGRNYFGWFKILPYGRNHFAKFWFGWQFHPLDGSDRYMLKFAIAPYRTFEN